MNKERLNKADENYFALWCAVIQNSKQGSVIEENGLLITDCGMPIYQMNILALIPPVDHVQERLQTAINYFNKVRRPFRLIIRAGYEPLVGETALSMGLQKGDPYPGMFLGSIKEIQNQSLLCVKKITDEAGLDDFRKVSTSAYEMAPGLADRLITRELINSPNVNLFVGYFDHKAVSCAILVTTKKVAGIYWVGTLKGFERQKFGESITRAAIKEGADQGCTWANLQTTRSGEAVYERIGFKTLTIYHNYVFSESE